MIAICVLLFLLGSTGLNAHIAISVVGAVTLIAYSVLTKKDWKLPALEIIMRVFYGLALISGIVIMNVHGVAAIAIIHKICAVLFMALLIILLTHKVATNKKA